MLLDVDYESYQAPLTNGQEGPIWDLHNVHDHGSAKAERVCPNVF